MEDEENLQKEDFVFVEHLFSGKLGTDFTPHILSYLPKTKLSTWQHISADFSGIQGKLSPESRIHRWEILLSETNNPLVTFKDTGFFLLYQVSIKAYLLQASVLL